MSSNPNSVVEQNSTTKLYITHLDHVGPYLKISGQLNRDAVSVVHSRTLQLLPACFVIDPSWSLQRQQALLMPGTFCLYKRVNGSAPADCDFLRACVINATVDGTHKQSQMTLHVKVEFLDFGYTATVTSYELLFPKKPELIQSIPILCNNYIMLGICADWKRQELEDVLRLIINETVEITIEHELYNQKFININWKDFNFSEFLIQQKKIGAPIDNKLLLDHFEKIVNDNPQMFPVAAKVGNNNNNNYYYNNNNVNNNQVPKSATELAREQLAARRSLAARLEQHRHPGSNSILLPPPKADVPLQTPVIVQSPQPRLTQSLGVIRNMVQGVNTQNNRIPYTGLYYAVRNQVQPAMPINSYGHLSAKPMDIYHARYEQSGNQLREAPSSIQRPMIALSQQRTLQTAAEETVAQQPTPPAVFKYSPLTIGETYDVIVSFVENGPYCFSVQLKNTDAELTAMMNRMENIRLAPLKYPNVGMACVARFSEDNNLYRALISGVFQNSCRVLYVDYGNSETVTHKDLYVIPPDFLEAKPYSMRFMLSGTKQLEPIDYSLKKAFKDMVIYNVFKLKVMPLEGLPLVQYCQLTRNNLNILESLRQIKEYRLVYPKAEPLKTSDIVEIRYIDSPRNFYVQKQENIKDFEQLMDEMFAYYNTNQKVPETLWLGSPCIVKYENEWYRAEIMRNDPKAIVVRHVDFGYEQRVTRNLLSIIAPKHLTMPRQAVQCCLKGFENNELEKSVATDQFEMLAEESNLCRRLFTVHVFRIQPDGVNIVNLTAKNLNVMKKLYKLSMPFEQYLTLEKEEFNIPGNAVNRSKTPSIASSNDCGSLDVQKKGILNSTTLQSDERVQLQKQQQHQQQRHKKNNKSDSDKQSNSSGSKDNRDSRSSSSELQRLQAGKGTRPQLQQQPQQQQHHQQQQHQQQQQVYRQPVLAGRNSKTDTSFDSRSNGSYGSGYSNESRFSKQQNNKEVPPRFQNGKRDATNNSRLGKNQSPRKQDRQTQSPQQQKAQQNQRSQNAPQGFSQKPQRQKSTLNANAISKKSNGTDSASVTSEASTKSQPEVYLPLDSAFITEDIRVPRSEEVTICWWVSPHQFYVQLKSKIPKYEKMLREMQNFYKQKPHQQLQIKVGSYVMARYRKENVIQRARILACNQMLRKYKVHFVDMGNQYTVTSEDIWQVEERFAKLPCMAYRCSFDGIVSNNDHLYIIDRMDKHLPQGAIIKCEFIRQHKSIYYVNVLVNDVSLKETLKNVGFITEIGDDISVELLSGQQIRAKFIFIKDMLNFKIQLEGCKQKIPFLCSYDDVRYVKSIADKAKKFKQFYENKSCVFNIKDVNENKVILLRPMMPLFKDDIPSNICTHPIILKKFQARVVYIAAAYRLYVQPMEIENEMDALLNDMFRYYEAGGKPIIKIEKDQICAARSSDGNWYRARIVSTEKVGNIDTLQVFYIDYGNYEKLPRSELRVLAEQFYLQKNAYALEVNLPISQIINEAAVKAKLDECAMEKVVTVVPIQVVRNRLIADVQLTNNLYAVEVLLSQKLIKTRDVEYIRKKLEKENPNTLEYIELVDLTLEEEDEEKKYHKNSANSTPKHESPNIKKVITTAKPQIQEKEIKATEPEAPSSTSEFEVAKTISEVPAVASPAPATTPVVQTTATAQAEEEAKPPTPVDTYADMETAVLSHCDNPAQFYVHLQDKVEELQKLQENLQIVSPSLPQLMNVNNGAECISMYSVDKQWYRAKILDAELMVLQFIDFGNTDCVSDTTDVKESMWSHEKPYCIPCALPIRPNGTADWVDAANAIFNESYTKLLHFEYITRGDYTKHSYINLFIEGVNVAEKLIADGYAKPLEVITSGENCYISHVNSISDFYIQFEKDSKALELIEIYLTNATEQLAPLKKFEKGLIVAALFEEDQLWYRAELLREVANQSYEVRFIDYGNTSISRECRHVSEKISNLPALSKKCALEPPESCLGWSDEVEAAFAEIAALGETIFTVKLRQPAADHVLVHLLIDDHNIIDDLEAFCPKKMPPPSKELNINSANTSMQASSDYESGTKLGALVTQINSPLDFYVQLDKDTARIEHITNSLNEMCLEALKTPAEVGQLYAVRSEEDNSLYRALVFDVIPAQDENQRYSVLFVDYGIETVASELYSLPQDIRDLKVLAKHCQLEFSRKFTQMPAVATDTLNALLDGCDFTVKLEYIDADASPALVKLFTNDNKALNICKQLHQLLENAQDSAVNDSNDTQKCIISHANSPASFYIQFRKNSAELEFVTKTLQKAKADKFAVLDTDKVLEGIIAVCYSQEDDCYYRCSVLEILADNSGYKVCLVDYGNTITVKELRQVPTQINRINALAVHCKLNAIPKEVDATKLEEAFNALLEAHFGELYEVKSIERDTSTNGCVSTVQLLIDYKDLAEELVNSIKGDVQSPLPELYECGIVQYDSATSFYIQLIQDTSALEHITDKLLDAEADFAVFIELKVGAICAAQFPEDGAYYRAQIIQLLEDGKCEVLYVDFGNKAITDKFRTLPDDIGNLPYYSKHCQLDVGAIAKCDDAQLQAFIEPRFSEAFHAEFLTTTDPCIVRLFYQGKNVIEECRNQWQEKNPSSGEPSLESAP